MVWLCAPRCSLFLQIFSNDWCILHLILIGYQEHFAIAAVDSTTQGIPFDVASLTLHDSRIFSRNNQPTIEYLTNYMQKNWTFWQKSVPSTLDILHLNLVYCRGKYNADKELYYLKGIPVKRIACKKYVVSISGKRY